MNLDARVGVGPFLRGLRQAHGWTLEQTAQAAGVARVTLNRWETGRHEPRLPELEAVLVALHATPAQKRRALACMTAHRAHVQLVQTAARLGEQTGIGLRPNGGDLLRAMRRRRGLGQERVAAQVGVTTRTLQLWERGDVQPPTERLHALCYALGAREEEVIALTCGPLAPSAHDEKPSLDLLDCRYRTTRHAAAKHIHSPLRELHLLALQAQVWPLALRSAPARELLAEIYTDYADYLSDQSRFQEAGPVAETALAMLPPNAPLRASFWLRGAIAYGRCLVYRGATPAPERGLRWLQPWLVHARWPSYRAWMLAGMANFHALAGRATQALELSEAACEAAQESINPDELGLRQMDRAQLLLRTGSPAAALPLLLLNSDRPRQQACILLLRTEACLALNYRAEAHEWLQQAAALLPADDLAVPDSHVLLSRAEELALRF